MTLRKGCISFHDVHMPISNANFDCDSETEWYLPKGYKKGKDKSPKYIVSETQLRQLFCMKYAPLNFNKDYVAEFIEKEELNNAT